MMEDVGATREQVRKIDHTAINEIGIDGLILMENAGLSCVNEITDMLGGKTEGRKITVLCGKGNNGGDGFVIARHLFNSGAIVDCCLMGEIETALSNESDAAVNLNVVLNMGISVREVTDVSDVAEIIEEFGRADIVVDALLGTGASGDVRGLFRPLIDGINNSDSFKVFSVDVPSGLDCNTGEPLGVAVQADRTATFVLAKKGFFRAESKQYTGQVHVAKISMPEKLIEDVIQASPQKS